MTIREESKTYAGGGGFLEGVEVSSREIGGLTFFKTFEGRDLRFFETFEGLGSYLFII